MADHIPFLRYQSDLALYRKYYADSLLVRIPAVQGPLKPENDIPSKIWVDPSIDGMHEILVAREKGHELQTLRNEDWMKWLAEIVDPDCVTSPDFLRKPDPQVVNSLAGGLLDRCLAWNPSWISIPQLPMMDGSIRNRLNRELALASSRWREETYSGKFILPVMLTHQNQYLSKTDRNKIVAAAKRCMEESKADGLWVADLSLNDRSGSQVLEHKRFPALVSLHEELRAAMTNCDILVAGPYWGMNLLLWARGLASHPAISMGGGFGHTLSGAHFHGRFSAKIALAPLRQSVRVTPQVAGWINRVLRKQNLDTGLRLYLEDMLGLIGEFSDSEISRRQVADMYKHWFDTIAAAAPENRAVALFYDLAAAYVLGKSLPELPKREGMARIPGQVARTLMMNCL